MAIARFLAREWQLMRNRVVWSLAGWRDAWANEASLRMWSLANLLSVIALFLLPLTSIERMLIMSLGILILAMELANTGLERVIDLVSPDENDLARRAKDCGSAAVAITAISAGVAWVWALWQVFGGG
jgi:diacylglycerol kinase (ATP)